MLTLSSGVLGGVKKHKIQINTKHAVVSGQRLKTFTTQFSPISFAI